MSSNPITVKTLYQGDLRTQAEHVRSGNQITTDAPVDNQGKGEAFSPTDLLAASFTSCMLTIMGIAAREHGFSIDGTRAETTKIMQASPRKVAELVVHFDIPNAEQLSESQKRILKRAAETCPVHLSLHPDLKKTVSFNWN